MAYVSISPSLYPITITCTGPRKCGQVRAYRLEPVGVVPAAFTFCPVCGSPASSALNFDHDMFEVWATELSIPVALVQALYEAWDYNINGSFISWAREQIKNFEAVS